MAILRIVNRPDGSKTLIRHELESASEHPLSTHEEIINELLDRIPTEEEIKEQGIIRGSRYIKGIQLWIEGAKWAVNKWKGE